MIYIKYMLHTYTHMHTIYTVHIFYIYRDYIYITLFGTLVNRHDKNEMTK